MAESIAKLAVVITGDAGPLAREMVRAEQGVKRFAAGTDGATRSTLRMGQALSASRGNLAALWNLQGAGPATGLIAAAAAAATFTLNMARAADEMQRAIGNNVAGTWTGQWDKLKEEFAASGFAFADMAREITRGVRDIFAVFRDFAHGNPLVGFPFSMIGSNEEVQLNKDKLREARGSAINMKAAEELAAKQKKADDDARERAKRNIEEMTRNANRFIETLNTPWEDLIAKVTTLKGLLESGAISKGRFDQSFDRLFEKFRESEKKPPGPERRGGVAAPERFTTAGQSAVEAGQRELERIQRLNQQQLDEDRKAAQQRQQLIEAVKNIKPTNIFVGGL